MSLDQQKTISKVVDEKLCTSCGACSTVCPINCITFKETVGGHYFPYVDSAHCINCGQCLNVCPGIHFGSTLQNRMSKHPFRGTAIEAFIGKATDDEIFNNSQSGGVATALALHMLESKQADAILTVIMDWGNPPRARAQLARSRKELLESQKSKYCPIPILETLRDIEKKGLERVVLIGIPCQIHGLNNIRDVMPELVNKIVLTIGLFCANTMTLAATDHLILEAKLSDKAKKKHIIYRDRSCGGYPGNVHIRTSDSQSSILQKNVRWNLREYYMPARCRLCFDRLNVFSDITLGDPWRLENVDEINGESAVVVRTELGHSYIKQVIDNNKLSLRSIEYNKIADGQNIVEKEIEWGNYIYAWKSLGHNLANYSNMIIKNWDDSSDVSLFVEKLKKILLLDNYESREELIKDVQNRIKKDTQSRKRFGKILFRYGTRMVKSMTLSKNGGSLVEEKEFTTPGSFQILTFGASTNMNFGGPSILYGLDHVIHTLYPTCKIVHYQNTKSNKNNCKGLDITIKKKSEPAYLIVGSVFYCLFKRSLFGLNIDNQLKDIKNSKLVLDIWGIEYCDKLDKVKGNERIITKLKRTKSYMMNNSIVIVARILGIPVYKTPASFGPILSPTTKNNAHFYLNFCFEHIYAREKKSKKALTKIGIDKRKIDVFPDSALAMKYIDNAAAPKEKPIGISISHQIIKQWKSPEPYIDTMISFIDHLIKTYNRDIWLFPNELSVNRKDDDLAVATVIDTKVNSKRLKIIDPTNISALDLKGHIANCEVLVASRYHSCVASLSAGVPLLVIGWHYKYEELLGHYEQGTYILSESNCTDERLKKLFQQLWNDKQNINIQLINKHKSVTDKIYYGIDKLIRDSMA